MMTFPKAKINLGLNIVGRRPDGYHDLETVFYEVPLCDSLEVTPIGAAAPYDEDCELRTTGIHVEGDNKKNLVVRAYNLLKEDFPQMGRVKAHLHKAIPTQAGMGGGSSDATAMLRLLNELFALHISDEQLEAYATRLGADCPFFVRGKAAYAEGIGERLQPIGLSLSGWHLAVVRPPVAVSTKEAFALVAPRRPQQNCLDVVMQPVSTWRDWLTNDFEQSVFAQYPMIGQVKRRLYEQGAAYAAMSGSGSAVFGLFSEPVDGLDRLFPDSLTYCLAL